MEIYVEHTNEDQRNYDMADFERGQLLGEESLVDVDVIERDSDSDATSEECESFQDSDYSSEEDDVRCNL